MIYILDTNSISKKNLLKVKNYISVVVIDDILIEYTTDKKEKTKIENYGVRIINLNFNHYLKMIEIMNNVGKNLKLINLLENEGVGDIAIMAYVLNEVDDKSRLFTDEFIVVTKDKHLSDCARSYKIKVVEDL